MHSDDLKPRRTPLPAMFSDMIPRPSVPDLSIIETSQSSAPAPPNVSVQSQTVLNHLSYNDWRLKTGNAPFSGVAKNIERGCDPTSLSSKHCSPTIKSGNGSPRDITGYPKEKVTEHLSNKPLPPVRKIVTYTDFQKRPTSAPAVRTQQVESVGDHPLSKSAPPTRPSNLHTHHTSAPNGYTSPTAEPNAFVSQSHAQNGFRNIGNMHAQYHILQPQPNVEMPESLTNQQGPHAIRPFTSANLDNFDVRSQNNGRNSELLVPYKDMKSNVQLASNESSYHPRHAYTHQERNYNVHPAEYHQLRKSGGSWSFPDQGCCMSSVACHHPSQLHPLHSVPYPQVSYDELYKIVLAQNDQLKTLQAQVERLLVSQDQQQSSAQAPLKEKEVEKLPALKTNPAKAVVTEEGTQTSDCEYAEDDCQKMSIGVMTSFIQTVTYRGRVGRNNVSEHEGSQSKNSNSSKSPSSDDSSTTSASSTSKSSSDKGRMCCKECSSKEGHIDVKNHSSKPEKVRQISRDVSEQPRTGSKMKKTCSEGCNCNNPGVSAAISAVRGCQAVLASKAGMTPNEYSTFNGADLPTVTEQPVSPMSSVHVDLPDYRSSSSDEESNSTESDDSENSEENDHKLDKSHETAHKPFGRTFYNNVLGQVNKILEERDVGNSSPITSKQTDVSVSKRVAFEATGIKGEHNLKEMALRYLKENHPEELASSLETKKPKKTRGGKGKERGNFNMPAPNMSFATFRYLERYNLLPENFNPEQYLEEAANIQGYHGNTKEPYHSPILNRGSGKQSRLPSGKVKSRSNFPQLEPSRDINYQLQTANKSHPKGRTNPAPLHHASSRKHPQATTATSKILDITTLRQQPKLL